MAMQNTASTVLPPTTASGPVGRSQHEVLHTLQFNDVHLADASFLGRWQARNAAATIQHLIDNLETSGVLHNFRRVADAEEGEFVGMDFADSDLYKTLEAIGWESARRERPVHTAFVDDAIALITRTQQQDGYINTRVQGDPLQQPWARLIWSHELYCAGHLIQAAVALSRGAHDNRLLTVAERFVDRILVDLGERADGFDGHAEIETALVELYRHTHDRRYLDFARDQIERRGHGNLPKDPFGRDYFGDHEVIDLVDEATGHAVRQLYYMTGATDVFLETGDIRFLGAAGRIWDSAYTSKTYITGGQGSRHFDESFGDPFELPADRAYTETCAGIASFQWNWRMLLATGQSRFAAEMERVLYNTIAASVGVDGCHFFYTNPLQMRTGHRGAQQGSPSERLSWFECACCPPNLARLIAALHSYTTTTSDNGIQLHHLAAGEISTQLPAGAAVVRIEGDYPWSGDFTITVEGSCEFELAIRIPSWVEHFTLTLDGRAQSETPDDGYIRLRRNWSQQVVVALQFDVQPTFVFPNARIDATRASVAVQRGPLVYCLEAADNPGQPLEDLRVDTSSTIVEAITSAPGAELALTLQGSVVAPEAALYSTGHAAAVDERAASLTAIPYFAWGNRGEGAMRVWIPTN